MWAVMMVGNRTDSTSSNWYRASGRYRPRYIRLYRDTLDPYHYVRLENGRGATQYVIVGGADHAAGATFLAAGAWLLFFGNTTAKSAPLLLG